MKILKILSIIVSYTVGLILMLFFIPMLLMAKEQFNDHNNVAFIDIAGLKFQGAFAYIVLLIIGLFGIAIIFATTRYIIKRKTALVKNED